MEQVQKPNPPKAQTITPDLTCKYCKYQISPGSYYCSNCGKKLKEPPFKFSWPKTIGLTIFSVLFPPLGIIPGIRYLLIKDKSARTLGIFLIAITIILTIVTIFIFKIFLDNLYGSIDTIYQTNYLLQDPAFIQ